MKRTMAMVIPAVFATCVLWGGTASAQKLTMGGRLDVLSEPARARVSVDGNEVGITPLQGLKIPVGEHLLRVEREGYLPKVRKFTNAFEEFSSDPPPPPER